MNDNDNGFCDCDNCTLELGNLAFFILKLAEKRSPGISLLFLSARLNVPHSTTLRLLSRMVGQGWVELHHEPHCFSLTALGSGHLAAVENDL